MQMRLLQWEDMFPPLSLSERFSPPSFKRSNKNLEEAIRMKSRVPAIFTLGVAGGAAL